MRRWQRTTPKWPPTRRPTRARLACTADAVTWRSAIDLAASTLHPPWEIVVIFYVSPKVVTILLKVTQGFFKKDRQGGPGLPIVRRSGHGRTTGVASDDRRQSQERHRCPPADPERLRRHVRIINRPSAWPTTHSGSPGLIDHLSACQRNRRLRQGPRRRPLATPSAAPDVPPAEHGFRPGGPTGTPTFVAAPGRLTIPSLLDGFFTNTCSFHGR